MQSVGKGFMTWKSNCTTGSKNKRRETLSMPKNTEPFFPLCREPRRPGARTARITVFGVMVEIQAISLGLTFQQPNPWMLWGTMRRRPPAGLFPVFFNIFIFIFFKPIFFRVVEKKC